MEMTLKRLLFAVVLVVSFANLSRAVNANVKNAMMPCIKAGGVTQEDFKTLQSPAGPNQKMKCMISCTMKGLKFMKADNSFDKGAIKGKFPAQGAPSVDACVTQAEPQKEQCQRGFTFAACMMMREPKLMSGLVSAE